MSAWENARKNGQPCARCGMKYGAHDYRNPHPRACRAWETAASLAEEREQDRDDMDAWMLDPEMEAKG